MTSRRCIALVVVCLAVMATASGCAHSTTGGGDASGGAADAPSSDSPFAPWDGSVGLFGGCTASPQCRDALGAQCLTTFSGGLCSQRCTVDGDCGASGVCVFNVCLPGCVPGRDDCARYGGACGTQAQGQPPSCRPSCTPVGTPACPTGTVCDPYSGACTMTPTTTGADNGEPCVADDECRGSCLSETNWDGTPSGYIYGYCSSIARSVDGSAVMPGQPLPMSSCPPGSVMPPSGSAGDAMWCMRACVSDADCREGYACASGPSGARWSNGYCAPIDCHDGLHVCPAGYVCIGASGGSPVGLCARI